jgi:hypothetical protein
MLSTITLLALVSSTQAGIFDTLFGVVKTVVNNNGKIQVGDIVKNIAMTNMVNLPNIPGVDIGGLLNGVGGLVGMKVFGGGATPVPTMPAVVNPDPAAVDPNTNTGGTSNTGLLGTAGNWFSNFFKPTSGTNTDPSSGWLNILSTGANALGSLTGGGSTGGGDTTGGGSTGGDTTGGGSVMQPQPVVMSSKTGVGSPCRGVTGTCLDSSVSTCSPAFLTGKCPGPNEVRCCPSGGVAGMVMSGSNQDPDQPVSSGGGSCSSYGGLTFPLASGSLSKISVAWGGSRQGGKRCHAGLDIHTQGPQTVVAVSDGVVVNIMRNWYSCAGGTIDAIMVYHESGALAGKTINYGEVNPGTYTLGVGSRVSRGQRIATASRCKMLHFELYSGRQTGSQRWYPASGSVGAGCASNSLSTKPSVLLDPRPLIRCTMPANARFNGGVGFLNSAEIGSLSDEGEEGEEATGIESVGAIVGIVIAFLVVIALVVGVVVAVRIRRARRANAPVMTVTNDAYAAAAYATTAPADFGHFTCTQCGKEYNYQNDLVTHVATRHGAV